MPVRMTRRKRTTQEKIERAEFLESKEKQRKEKALADWSPKTDLGRLIINNELKSFEEIAEKNLPLMEPEIIDSLLPDMEEKLVEFRKTTRVTRQGRSFSFRAAVLVGDRFRHVGIGVSKDKEKIPAIKKAAAAAKMNLITVRKGCGSWECSCSTEHSIPFKVEGKSASVRVKLIPAPKGTGLVCGENIKDVLRFAGVTDVWCQSRGSTGTKLNFIQAAVDALKNTSKVKASNEMRQKLEKREMQ